MRVAAVVATAVAAFLALASSLAQAAFADVDVRVEHGHGGTWVQDAATPLDVLLRNTGRETVTVRLSLATSSGMGDERFTFERTVSLAPGAVRREGFLFAGTSGWMPGQELRIETEPSVPVQSPTRRGDRGSLQLDLNVADPSGAGGAGTRGDDWRPVGVLLDPRASLRASMAAYAEIVTPGGAAGIVAAGPVAPRVLPVDAESLRLAPLALDGLVSLVVCDPDATFCADPAHLENLLDWVALGGRLVVTLGEHAPDFASSPLAAEMPARWTGVERRAYEDAFAQIARIDPSRIGWSGEGPAARLADPPAAGARVRVPGLWVERPFGDGTIALVAIDLRRLAGFLPSDARQLETVADLLAPPGPVLPWAGKKPWERNEFDVSGRIGRALQQDAFRPPPLAAVVLALAVYVVVVGPLDWLVLRRLRKERLTTLTFAGAVAAFTVLAYGVSYMLFSSDAVVNRVTFVRLADGGRAGRALVRVHDLAGFYAPTGGTRSLTYPMPAAVLGGGLPGLHASGGVGASLPIVVRGTDPLRSRADLEVAFRSQRVVYAVSAGATGRTLSVAKSGERTLEVTNALPVDLEACWIFQTGGAHTFGRVAAGDTSGPGTWKIASELEIDLDGPAFGVFGGPGEERDPAKFRRFLAAIVSAPLSAGGRAPSGWESLRRAGVVRDPPGAGRALLVAVAAESPVPLPEGDARGRRHVVITQEIDLP